MMIEDLKYSFPWHGNGVYLKSNDDQTKATCSSEDIAKYLAAAVNSYEYRDDYLHTAIDFQKKAMTLIENTNSINIALKAVDETFKKLDDLSARHATIVNQVNDISKDHDYVESSIVQLSSSSEAMNNDIGLLKRNICKFSTEYQRVNDAVLALNHNQQQTTNNLLTATAMQCTINQKFNQLSSQQNAIGYSINALNLQKNDLCQKIHDVEESYLSCRDNLSQLKVQQNVLRYNMDEVDGNQRTINSSINAISAEQDKISSGLDNLKSQNLDNARALETFNNFIADNTKAFPKDTDITINSQTLEEFIVTAKCLLMSLKSVKIDVVGLNVKVLQLAYTDFLNKVLKFEKILEQKHQDADSCK